MRRTPPHIVVTTPESLYIMLGSESGRKMLATTRTVIVDEIHAVAPNKRGSHLAISLERLAALCGSRLLRIGLSATQKPIEAVARFLVGPDAECRIIDTGHRRARDLALEIPASPLEAVMSGEVWQQVYDRLAELIEAHRTTLVFVNTRRLAERVTRQLSERLGAERVTAHHGSLAKEQRFDAEQRLKAGALKALVATASLELGIDIGDVDLVCQLGSPRSIASLLQRVGRSGHAVAGTPKGRLFPLSRDELVECAALLDSVRRGELDRLVLPEQPLDVLGAADRRRGCRSGVERGRALRADLPRLALPRAAARGFHRRGGDAGRRVQHPPRPARGSHSPRCGEPQAARPARRSADGADLRRHDPGQCRLSGAARAGEPDHRHGQRGLCGREHGRRHLPARQCRLPRDAGRTRHVARRGRAGHGAEHSVLARRSAWPHRRAVAVRFSLVRRIHRPFARRRYPFVAAGRGRHRRTRGRATRRISGLRSRGARGSADPGDASHRAVLRRSRRHATGHPFAVRQPPQPRLGAGAAQAVLPQIQFRAAGGGDRGQHRAVADPRAQLRSCRRSALPALGEHQSGC